MLSGPSVSATLAGMPTPDDHGGARLAIPLGPDPDAPIPTDAVEGVELATCARVAALTSRGVRQRDAVARLGLEPATYLRAETAWMLRLAAAALRRELSLVEAYDAAFAAARAELERSEP